MVDWYIPLSIGLGALVVLFMTGMPIFLGFLIVIISGASLS